MTDRGAHRIGRRSFLRASALATPALLAACTRSDRGSRASGSPSPAYEIAAPSRPVTLPVPSGVAPIDADLESESDATLDLLTWPNYLWPFVAERFGQDAAAKVRIQTFGNAETEEIPKLASGAASPDLAWTTCEALSRLATAGVLQPLNHSYIPNLRTNVWPTFRDPYYDRGWRYSVPYAVFTTGIAYRRDHVADAEVARKGWAILWDRRYGGRVGFYDDYRDAIGLALLRRGVTDLSTDDPAALKRASVDLRALREEQGALASSDGVLTRLAAGKAWLHQSSSGDSIAAQSYLAQDDRPDVLGFWWPPDHRGPVTNDAIVLPTAADDPVLAHRFVNFLLSNEWAVRNFSWTGYQPPLRSIDADRLVAGGYIPDTLARAVVREEDLARGLVPTELPAAVDRLWRRTWIQATADG